MKKNKKLLTLFLVALMLISICMCIVACTPPEDPSSEEPEEEGTVTTDGLIIPNGTFATATNTAVSAYLKPTVTGWTATNGAIKVSATGAIEGVVDLGKEDAFNAGKVAINDNLVDYPGIAPSTPKDENGNNKDTNALVLSIQKTAGKGSYYYTNANSINVEAGSYYKLSIDVYTDLIDATDKNGAAIILTNGVHSEFLSINTNKTWDTYTFYIEANDYEVRTFNVQLWLGHGPQAIGNSTNANPHLAYGTAFFDNIILDKIDANTYATKKATIDQAIGNGIDYVKDAEGNVEKTISLIYADAGFTQHAAYSSTLTGYSSSSAYYSAKAGAAKNYNFILGKEDLESKDEFPAYSSSAATSSNYTDPIGIFDMSKLYSFDDANVATDEYAKIYKGYVAPDYEDFYSLDGTTNKMAFNLDGRDMSTLTDTRALSIYHINNAISGAGYISSEELRIEANKYYKISVWAYIWVPDMAEPVKPEGYDKAESEKTDTEKANADKYDEQCEEWEKYQKYRVQEGETSAENKVYATFRLSGASIETENTLEVKTDGTYGNWQQLSLYVQGSDLSSRFLKFELWYGEGEWGASTLYPGGCLFDDITIEASDSPVAGASYEKLSPLVKEGFEKFGLIDNGTVSSADFTKLSDAGAKLNNWDYEKADEKTSDTLINVGVIGGKSAYAQGANTPGTFKVEYKSAETPFDIVAVKHNDYTASTLTFKNSDEADSFMEVMVNKFYRFSLWVKTVGVDDGMGATVALYSAEKDSSVSSITTLNTNGEWQEISFVVKGTATENQKTYLKVTFGSGDIYTPASHIKGDLYVTALTWQNVDYDEYKGITSSTYVKQVSLTSSVSSSDTVSNGNFQDISSENYDNNEIIHETTGEIIGAAVPASWTKNDATHALKTPSVTFTATTNKMSWDAVAGASRYYVFMNGYKDVAASSDETEDNVCIGYVVDNQAEDATESAYRFADANADEDKIAITFRYDGVYYVRAYGEVDGKQLTSGNSSSKTAASATGDAYKKYTAETGMFDYKGGIINYKKYVSNPDTFYGSLANGEYKSTRSDNLLMLSSNFYTNYGYTMSSTKAVSANNYYMISVWVKTEAGAKAYVTINNASSVLKRNVYTGETDNDGDFVGYVNIDTDGEWVEYRFYIKTELSSGSFKLELGLGNKYAKDVATSVDGLEISHGLSKGTVYFDDITFLTLANEAEYNKMAYGHEDLEGVQEADMLKEYQIGTDAYTLKDHAEYTGSYFTNKYVFKRIEYTTDSFDNYKEPTDDDIIGNTPSAYEHGTATDADSYVKPKEEDGTVPDVLYGVYNVAKLEGAVKGYLKNINGITEDQINNFLAPQENGGKNFLMMANITDNGQYYESNSYTFKAKSYYKISFFAKLLTGGSDKAEFRYTYGDDDDNWSTIQISGANWVEYSFYVYNEDDSDRTSDRIEFHLGTNDGIDENSVETKHFFSGILLVDNVSIEALGANGEATFNAADNSIKHKFELQEEAEKETEEEEDEDGEEDKERTNPQLWLMIASIVIGACLLAVVIVFAYRKVKRKLVKKTVKVENKVPVNINKANQKSAGNKRKKDINNEDFND